MVTMFVVVHYYFVKRGLCEWKSYDDIRIVSSVGYKGYNKATIPVV
jgi:hypothetical protein